MKFKTFSPLLNPFASLSLFFQSYPHSLLYLCTLAHKFTHASRSKYVYFHTFFNTCCDGFVLHFIIGLGSMLLNLENLNLDHMMYKKALLAQHSR